MKNINNMKHPQVSAKERIYKLKSHFDITTRELATIAEVSEHNLYHVTDETRRLTDRTANNICNNLKKKLGVNINREWLLTGEGEMIVPGETPYPANESLKKSAQSEINWQDRYYALLEEHVELQKNYIACLKKQRH